MIEHQLKVYMWDECVDPQTSRLARWPIGKMSYLVVAARGPHQASLLLHRKRQDVSAPRLMEARPIRRNPAFYEGARLALAQPGQPFWAPPGIRNPNASRLGISQASWKPLMFKGEPEQP